MTSQNQLALIIDPDPVHLEIMEGMLLDDMEVLLATTAKQGLELVAYKQPNVILMERKLPDMDGYELCKALKAKMVETPCAIIVLTEADDMYDRMEGYQSGCSEFLAKPFQVEELLTKIQLSVQVHAIQTQLKTQNNESMQVAMNAMKLGSELGTILEFVEESAQSSDYSSLGELVISTVANFDIQCSLLFKTFLGPQIVGCEPDSPEEHVLAMCSDKERFVVMGEKMIVNHHSVSLLVTNMPINDKTRYGELKDTLGIVINAIETRIRSLDTELKLVHERQGGVNEAIQSTQASIALINTEMTALTNEITQTTNELRLDVRDTCFSLDLNEEQEEMLLGKIDNAIADLENSRTHMTNVDLHLAEVTKNLTRLLNED